MDTISLHLTSSCPRRVALEPRDAAGFAIGGICPLAYALQNLGRLVLARYGMSRCYRGF